MDFWGKLTKAATAATATLSDLGRSVNEVMSLDTLQEQFGDPSGKRAMFEGLDVTYLSPRLIGECTAGAGRRQREVPAQRCAPRRRGGGRGRGR